MCVPKLIKNNSAKKDFFCTVKRVTYCLPVQDERCFDELDADDCAAVVDIEQAVLCP